MLVNLSIYTIIRTEPCKYKAANIWTCLSRYTIYVESLKNSVKFHMLLHIVQAYYSTLYMQTADEILKYLCMLCTSTNPKDRCLVLTKTVSHCLWFILGFEFCSPNNKTTLPENKVNPFMRV